MYLEINQIISGRRYVWWRNTVITSPGFEKHSQELAVPTTDHWIPHLRFQSRISPVLARSLNWALIRLKEYR